MGALQPLISEFVIVGRLEDFTVGSKNRIKYLYLSTIEENYSIEVAIEHNRVLSKHLLLGCWVKVSGMRKYELHREQVKYKAYRIELLPEPVDKTISDTASTTTKAKAKVLICQSSTCWKSGKAVYETLQTELRSQGIADRVEIKATGCLKQCKQAPNLIIMPGKVRYSRVQPKQVSKLITKHLQPKKTT